MNNKTWLLKRTIILALIHLAFAYPMTPMRLLTSRFTPRRQIPVVLLSRYLKSSQSSEEEAIPSKNYSPSPLEGSVVLPANLRNYLTETAKKTLCTWDNRSNHSLEAASLHVVESIIDYATKSCSDLDPPTFRSEVAKTSEKVFETIRRCPGDLGDVCTKSDFVEKLFAIAYNKTEKNRAIFNTISNVHSKIKVESSDEDDLVAYSRLVVHINRPMDIIN